MFSGIRRLLGNVQVTQTERHITISGIPADVMANDIARLWRTQRINNHMFVNASKNSLTFPLFFAPDVYYMLDQLIEYRNRRVNARVLTKIRDTLQEQSWLMQTDTDAPSRVDLRKINNLIYKPLDYQQLFFETYDNLTSKYNLRGYLLAAAAGSGKAQPLSSKVKVPGGWKRMGDIQVGDQVTAWDGTPTTVTGVYPQGKKPIYEIGLKDGRVVRATGDHLWKVYDRACYRNKDGGWKVVDTRELQQLLTKKGSMIYLPLCHSEQGEDVDLPLDPYLMGALLGDGGFTQGNIVLTKGDPAFFEEIQKALPPSVFLRDTTETISKRIIAKDAQENTVREALRDTELMGLPSHLKFLPDQYLSASHAQRLAVLQGLLDTDGYVDEQGTVSFSSSSPRLSTAVQKLVWSLGGIASLTCKETSYTYKGERQKGKPAYQINIRYPKPSELFRLPRKKARTNDNNQYADRLKLRVTSVKLESSEEAQCISVDHLDRLYVTDGFVVTHNTYMAYAVAEMLGSDHIVVFSPKNAIEEVWEAEVNKLFKKTPSYWMESSGKPYNKERVIIVHYEALKNVMALAKQLRGKHVTVILDESHNFNDLNSQRSTLYQKFLEEVDATDVIWASGTPIKALGAESIPLLRAIDPLFTEDAEQRYRKIYGRDGSKGLDILKHRIGFISYKVEKHQLGLDKPVIKRLPVWIKNNKDFTLTAVRREMEAFIKERYAHYKERRKEDNAFYVDCLKLHEETLRSKADRQAFKQYQAHVKLVRKYDGDARVVAEEIKATNRYEKEKIHPSLPQSHRKKFQDVKSIVKYLNLKIQGEALGRVVGRKRIECHVAMVPAIDFKGICGSTPKKTVVFTSFVQALEEANRHLTDKGMSPLMVYGKTNADLKKTVDLSTTSVNRES